MNGGGGGGVVAEVVKIEVAEEGEKHNEGGRRRDRPIGTVPI